MIKLRLNPCDLLALLVLLLAGLKFTFRIERVLDISLYDESTYLHSGVSIAREGLPAAAFAPLYALWYYALSLIQPDRVDLYYLNYVLTTILPRLLVYVLLRVNQVPMIPSGFAAAYLLISQANFYTWPRPTHFALVFVLLSGIGASFCRRVEPILACLATGAMLASYARPEYFLEAVS